MQRRRLAAQKGSHFHVPLDGVGILSAPDTMRVKKRTALPGFPKACAARSSCCPCDEAAPQKSLQIDHQIEPFPLELPVEAPQLRKGFRKL